MSYNVLSCIKQFVECQVKHCMCEGSVWSQEVKRVPYYTKLKYRRVS